MKIGDTARFFTKLIVIFTVATVTAALLCYSSDAFAALNVLCSFTDVIHGGNPEASLTLSGSTLYGTAVYGGAHGEGAIFKIKTDGAGYRMLRSFKGEADGSMPAVPNTLYWE